MKRKSWLAILGILVVASLVVLYFREDLAEEPSEEPLIEGEAVLQKSGTLVSPPDDEEFEPWKALTKGTPVTATVEEANKEGEAQPAFPKEAIDEMLKQKAELAELAGKHCQKNEAAEYKNFLNCMFPSDETNVNHAKECFKKIDTQDPELIECEERVQEAKARKYCNDEEVKEFVALSRCLTKGAIHKLLIEERFDEAEKVNGECMKEFSVSELSESCLSGMMGKSEEQP